MKMSLYFRKIMTFGLAGLLLAATGCEANGQPQKNKMETENARTVGVLQRWEMPASLTEISGIAPYKNLLAAIQDEDGIIFLVNPASGKVEKEIQFSGPGDYEGIAIVGETAWVLRADGQLFEVANFNSGTPAVRPHATPLGKKQDTEGLTYDAKGNRLLISVKGKDLTSADTKSVYAYDFKTNQLSTQPVYQLSASGEAAVAKKKKKKDPEIRPSEIALHSNTGDLYVLDGPAYLLYVLDASGVSKSVYTLDKKDFPQAEGLAFTPDGAFYISTEGGKGKGAIMEVQLAQ